MEIQYSYPSILSLRLHVTYVIFLGRQHSLLLGANKIWVLWADPFPCFESTSKVTAFYLNYQENASDMLLEKSRFTHQIKVCLFAPITSVFQMVLLQYQEMQ